MLLNFKSIKFCVSVKPQKYQTIVSAKISHLKVEQNPGLQGCHSFMVEPGSVI